MTKRRYPACTSTYYAPEELRSMEIWDAFCESEPLTLQEIQEANRRDDFLAPKKKHSPLTEYAKSKKREGSREFRKKNPEYMAEYRKKNHEEILAHQRAYYAAHKAELMQKQQKRRQRKREKQQKEETDGRV